LTFADGAERTAAMATAPMLSLAEASTFMGAAAAARAGAGASKGAGTAPTNGGAFGGDAAEAAAVGAGVPAVAR
jgi:hypothetical protein